MRVLERNISSLVFVIITGKEIMKKDDFSKKKYPRNIYFCEYDTFVLLRRLRDAEDQYKRVWRKEQNIPYYYINRRRFCSVAAIRRNNLERVYLSEFASKIGCLPRTYFGFCYEISTLIKLLLDEVKDWSLFLHDFIRKGT